MKKENHGKKQKGILERLDYFSGRLNTCELSQEEHFGCKVLDYQQKAREHKKEVEKGCGILVLRLRKNDGFYCKENDLCLRCQKILDKYEEAGIK